MVFITTLGGRQVRDPCNLFLDEESETQRGEWLTQEELKTDFQVRVFPCHIFQFSLLVEFHLTPNICFWLWIELRILLNIKFCALTYTFTIKFILWCVQHSYTFLNLNNLPHSLYIRYLGICWFIRFMVEEWHILYLGSILLGFQKVVLHIYDSTRKDLEKLFLHFTPVT